MLILRIHVRSIGQLLFEGIDVPNQSSFMN